MKRTVHRLRLNTFVMINFSASMRLELSSLCFINSYDLHCTFPVHDLPRDQVIWAVFTTGLLITPVTHLLFYQHWAFHSFKFVVNIPLSSSAVKARFTDHTHCLPHTSHLLMSFHSIYLFHWLRLSHSISSYSFGFHTAHYREVLLHRQQQSEIFIKNLLMRSHSCGTLFTQWWRL